MTEQGLMISARGPLHILNHTREMMIQQLLCALGRSREIRDALDRLSDEQLAEKWMETFDP